MRGTSRDATQKPWRARLRKLRKRFEAAACSAPSGVTPCRAKTCRVHLGRTYTTETTE